MKTRLFKTLMMGIVVFTLASCSDDETFLNIVEEQEILNTYRAGGSYTIDIQTNDNWTASIDEDADWIILLDKAGQGNHTIRIIAEHNYGDNSRNALLTVEAGGLKKIITINQSYLPEGEDIPDNSDLTYYDNVTTKGLGRGFDIRKMELKDPLFAMNGIKSLTETKGNFYNEKYIANPKFIVTDMDSLINKLDSLSVDSAHIGISYGLFKLNIKAFYKSTEKAGSSTIRLRRAVSLPKCMAEVFTSSIITTYDKSSTSQEEKDLLLSVGFAEYRDSIIKSLDLKDKDTYEAYMQALDDEFGVAVVTGSTLGGELSVTLESDSVYIMDYLNAGGSVDMAVKGIFNAGVSVDYQKAGTEIINRTNLQLDVYGGDIQKAQDLGYYLTGSHQLSAADINKYQMSWGESVDVNSNAEIIEWTLKGIWNLFPVKYRSTIKSWFTKQYEGCKTYDISKLK